jgi:chromosome segregation ATPase
MRTRYKIFIVLFTVTVILGAVTFVRSGNDTDALFRFRELFSNRTVYDVKHALTTLSDITSLWYGGLSLFAILMIVLVFRAARRNGSAPLRETLVEQKPAKVSGAKLRPVDTAPAKGEVESVLRQEVKKMADLLEVKNAAITELENNLSGKQQLLQNRNQELEAVKAKMNALTEQLTDVRLAKERAENLLQQELKKIKVLEAKDSVIAELENSLVVTRELLQSRGQELDGLKAKANALTEQLTDLRLAKERAENALQRELAKIEILQAKDSIIEQENGLSGQVEALQGELAEKQELLRTRSKELKAARSKANALRERLNTLTSTKEQMENVFQQQIKQKTELLQSKDDLIRELQETLNTRVRALEEQLKEREKLLEDRDAKLATFESEANNESRLTSVREEARSLLLQELQNRGELLQQKDILVNELQERLNATVHALENAHREVERLLRQRGGELPDAAIAVEPAKSQLVRKGLNTKLLELGAAKAQAAVSLRIEEGKSPKGEDVEDR